MTSVGEWNWAIRNIYFQQHADLCYAQTRDIMPIVWVSAGSLLKN